ncbi:VOC family protein [Streptantibioticus cattleyicolor]|uniref:Glyoxalase/bleomycin resistance protein/dioxygenase n=1 Tax=Streptantibioticus cattleyicolor (strain ATCC 35852 / DSM 46488 / JCM 4925 / NBRC 14057 / NRRL 8057) TaxID=1003195 RepID=F8JN35_STREN|nr:VOC family protein [Streptantibioticus cattleyicolor]AEW99214.1 Glyoxalase/bleomycin resistance protein/dioxygenase [Streptantibioticus cattleyicolor NRRL 8057 = DSM 46488]CCB71743.1 putative drug resistance protein; putative glyoxalase/bleomycin resistance protein/dioxygenase [Streptantibioticus cattleyicolor NRRL 8057 = DSM 46488]
MSVTIDGPDFVALQVRDLEAAAAFCERHLGLRRAQVSPPHAVVFDTEPTPFALREPLPGVDLDAVARPGLGVVMWFRTQDAHKLHDQLVAAGVTILTPITQSPFGPMFSFEGPEGYTLTAHGG